MTEPFKDRLKVFSVSLDCNVFLGVGKRNLGLRYENDQLDAFLLMSEISKCQVSHDVLLGQWKRTE